MAYRKLGVRSRTEMTGQFGGDVDSNLRAAD
jgi:hypothetical protein